MLYQTNPNNVQIIHDYSKWQYEWSDNNMLFSDHHMLSCVTCNWPIFSHTCILAAEVSLECCVCNAGEDIVFRATQVMESFKCSKGCSCKLQTSDVASPGAYNSCIGISDLAEEDGRTGRTAKFKADDWEIIRGLRQKSAKPVEPFTLRYS